MWAFIALLIVIAGLGGYVLGERSAPDAAVAAAQGEDVTAENLAALAALATPGANGSAGPGPEKKSDGTYDSMIVGPGGKLETQEDILNIHRRNPQDPFAIGAVDAPVVISEFSDFECPFCSRFANETEPTLLKEYVDKGLVRIEWNDFPVNGPNAVVAAHAGRAAAEQGKFNEFKDELYFASKDINGHPNFDMDDFVGFAKKAGVPDLEKFRADATGSKYDDTIDEARAYASGIGISGTPAFFIGDEYVSGAQPTDVFVQVINQQLAKTVQGTTAKTQK
ncbi:disulfide bond formation protein DsbA [Corynebacterium sp. 13CS0277]|uniref:DsbA family protein n=1 Tax=Corynebacterium sp. 13CS0277 TaxID=2071994 RepID=UPI000D03295A|nr:thioredoxin domain-containing protein [Corynebacterium sp. 13CS0277]PRQ12242.1 disulfide bond formation protein DsbA [Corynebacterium sp. 13CS0277]